MIRKVLKMVLAIIVGMLVGLLIGGVIGMLANGLTLDEYIAKFMRIDYGEIIAVVIASIIFGVLSMVLQVIIHESGHLVAGLMTGYRFVSFRIFSLTLLKIGGRYTFKRFALAGTGGQCLLAPPQRPLNEINTLWYNLGGVLANIVTAVICLASLFLFDVNPYLAMFLFFMVLFGFGLALLNGIPMKVMGIGNDGYNVFHLEKEPQTKRLLLQLLDANARVQSGAQIALLPEEWFDDDDVCDWGNGVETNWKMIVVARMLARHEWDAAYERLSEAMASKDKLFGLFRQEIEGEMIFVSLLLGHEDEALQLLSSQQRQYLEKYATTQSGKRRILAMIALKLDHDATKAAHIYDELVAHRNDYLMQGEVDMDIELLEYVLTQELSS